MIVLDDPDLARTPFPSASARTAADPWIRSGTSGPVSLKEVTRHAVRSAERDAIAKALELTGWNRTRAARPPQISHRALLYKIKDTGLSLPPPENSDTLGNPG